RHTIRLRTNRVLNKLAHPWRQPVRSRPRSRRPLGSMLSNRPESQAKESAMRFLCIYKNSMGEGAPPSPDEMSRMGSLMEEMSQAGVLKETGGCKPSALGARIRQIGSTATVTDGPFTDAKGIIGGYAIIETSTKADAIGWAKRFLAIHGDGESEVREL